MRVRAHLLYADAETLRQINAVADFAIRVLEMTRAKSIPGALRVLERRMKRRRKQR